MRDTVSLSLPPELRKRLDKLAKREHANRSDVVREALRRYLLDIEFEEACQPLVIKARQRGIFSDEDIFKAVS